MAWPEYIRLDKLKDFEDDPEMLSKMLTDPPVLSEKLCVAFDRFARNEPDYP
jgi:hypothetical protein